MDTIIIKKIVVLGFLLLTISTYAVAQQTMFKVYAVSGKVKVHKPGKKYRDLRVTDELSGDETIKVANGAVVNLICSNFAPVQISKGGTFKVADFSYSCEKEQAGLFSKYFEYIWTELLSKPVKPEAAPLQSMKNKGAVSRGCPGIELYYPVDTLKLVTHNWNLNWNASGKPVTVSLHDSEYDGAQLYSGKQKASFIATVAFIDALSEEDVNYLQVVPEGSSNCARFPVVKTSLDEYNAFMHKQLLLLPSEKSSSYYFMRSLIEEEHKYLGEALANLTKAIALEPANEVYKNHLALFKTRYNLK